jgi:hypothetical protein
VIEINDHGTFKKMATRLKVEARQLPPEVVREMQEQGEKLKRDIEQRAATILPKSGGLATAISKMDMTVKKIPNGVTLEANSRYNLETIDRGSVVHPVYGNRRAMVRQAVSAGFWSEPLKANEPAFVAAVERALDKMAKGVSDG